MTGHKEFCRKITTNGAMNLYYTIKTPHEVYPDLINGGHRMFTGLGKYTTLAHIGVENHLVALGLSERRYIDWNHDGRGWKSLCLTPLGREVAQYIHDHWDSHELVFRDEAREVAKHERKQRKK